MTYKLYLDDERNPKGEGWTIVRDFDSFVQIILEKGLPESISFDHDLGEDSLSGYEASKWLIDYGLDNNIPVEDIVIQVHSANPVGAANIRGIWKSYEKFKQTEED